jgi:hypothetical protein
MQHSADANCSPDTWNIQYLRRVAWIATAMHCPFEDADVDVDVDVVMVDVL